MFKWCPAVIVVFAVVAAPVHLHHHYQGCGRGHTFAVVIAWHYCPCYDILQCFVQLHVDSGVGGYFELDAVFDEGSTQRDVYAGSGAQRAVSDDLFQGYNCTILAYGQTGAGKTFTMGTAPVEGGGDDGDGATDDTGTDEITDGCGIIPRAVRDLFHQIGERCDGEAHVELSYLEVYNEEIRDLLVGGDPHKGKQQQLRIREHMDGEVYVRGLTSVAVASPRDVGRLMEEGATRRVTGSTEMNAASSRSHAICVLRVRGVLDENDTKFSSKLTLVDLAGSERLKKTRASGSRAQEGISINLGLFTLGQVVA